MGLQELRASADGTVIFDLSERRYGLALAAVERVVRVADVTPLPGAPDIVIGVIDVQGRIIPVLDVRCRFGLPKREIALTDQLIVAHTKRRPVALLVDAARGVLDRGEGEIVAGRDVLDDMRLVEGVVRLDDGLVLIHDLDRFLSLQEEAQLDDAMAGT